MVAGAAGAVLAVVGGRRRVASSESGYVARVAQLPGYLSRVERRGRLQLLEVAAVQARGPIDLGLGFARVAIGNTLVHWELRQALSYITQPLGVLTWCESPGRTVLERQAVLERLIADLGLPVRTIGGVR